MFLFQVIKPCYKWRLKGASLMSTIVLNSIFLHKHPQADFHMRLWGGLHVPGTLS